MLILHAAVEIRIWVSAGRSAAGDGVLPVLRRGGDIEGNLDRPLKDT